MKELSYYQTSFNIVNYLIKKGKKPAAERILDFALKKYSHRLISNSLLKARPVLGLKIRRKRASTKKRPIPLKITRSKYYVMKWLLEGMLQSSERTARKKFVSEITGILKGEGNVLKKRDELHRQAASNRALVYSRW